MLLGAAFVLFVLRNVLIQFELQIASVPNALDPRNILKELEVGLKISFLSFSKT